MKSIKDQLVTINAENRRWWTDPDNRHAAAVTSIREAREQADQALRRKGTQQSAVARKNKNVERDRRIRAAVVGGMKPKNIAADEKLSPSQVRKILQKPLP